MKRTAFFLLAACLLLTGCHRTQKFTITGDLAGAGLPESITSFRITSDELEQPFNVTVNEDKTFSFKGEVKKPTFAKLVSSSPDQKAYPAVILEKGNITFSEFRPVGTPSNDANKAFTDQITALRIEHRGDKDATIKAAEEAFIAYVAQHKNDPCAIYAILLADHRLYPKTILKLIESTSAEIRNTGEIRQITRRMKELDRALDKNAE